MLKAILFSTLIPIHYIFSVIPVPFPLIGYFVFTKSHTVGEGEQAVSLIEHAYMAETMCFIQPETIAFYTLFLPPLCLCIIINLAFFGMVAKVIKNSKSVANISENEKILVRKGQITSNGISY